MQKSKQQKEIETLKAKVQQLESENKELRSIAESKADLAKENESLKNRLDDYANSCEVFKNKYLALNNAIKEMATSNENTIAGSNIYISEPRKY